MHRKITGKTHREMLAGFFSDSVVVNFVFLFAHLCSPVSYNNLEKEGREEGRREERKERKKKGRKKERERRREGKERGKKEGRERKKTRESPRPTWAGMKREGRGCSARAGIWQVLAALSYAWSSISGPVLPVSPGPPCPQRCTLALLSPAGEAVAWDSLRTSALGMLPQPPGCAVAGRGAARAQPLGLSGSHFY